MRSSGLTGANKTVLLYAVDAAAPQPSLLSFHGTINGHCAHILLDPGCRLNVISTAFVHRHRLPTTTRQSSIDFVFANGSSFTSHHDTLPLRLSIGPHQETTAFHLCNLRNYDLFLGMAWLQQWNPTINWTTGRVPMFHTTNPIHNINNFYKMLPQPSLHHWLEHISLMGH